MLENLSREPARKEVLGDRAQLIPNPWDIPSDLEDGIQMPENWQLPVETHPLIKAAGSPEALRLREPCKEPELKPVQILLQGELKLKAGGGLIANQIEQAVALLLWDGDLMDLGATG